MVLRDVTLSGGRLLPLPRLEDHGDVALTDGRDALGRVHDVRGERDLVRGSEQLDDQGVDVLEQFLKVLP